MTTEIELRKWLHRTDKTPMENLFFGIKAWNSVEFVLPSKYDIIVEYFCEIFESGAKGFTQNDWDIVNQFLELNWGPSTVSSPMKRRLVESVIGIVSKTKKPKVWYIESALLVLHHNALWNYYKNDVELFSLLAARIFRYYTAHIRNGPEEFNFEPERARVTKLLEFIKEYVKVMAKSPEFDSKFRETYSNLTAYLLAIEKHFEAFQYFDEFFVLFVSSAVTLPYAEFQEWFQSFHDDEAIPQYAVLMFIEGFLGTSVVSDERKCFIVTHLMGSYCRTQQLQSMGYLLKILRKRNVDIETIQEDICNRIVETVSANKDSATENTLSILCATIRLNPILVSKHAVNFIVDFMFMRKTAKTTDKFYEFLELVVEMFKKLYQTKVFIVKLIEAVELHLKNHKLSKKLKRKLDDDDSVMETSVADQKDAYFLDILMAEPKTTSELLKSETWDEISWPDIEYAWPCRIIAPKIIKSIALLVPDLSLSIWQTILFSFNKSVSTLVTTDENTLFHSDFLASLMLQYFAGSRIAESVHNIKGPKLDKLIDGTKSFLKSFAEKILHLEHNPRLMHNFLNLCLFVGYFELMILFYYPDSMCQETNAEATAIDFPEKAKILHDYITADEWVLIEQRIVNFGKSECKASMNRLRLQKNQAYNLFASVQARIRVSSNLLTSTLTDSELLLPILNDKVLNAWFIEHLTRDEKQKVVETILAHHVTLHPSVLEDYEFTTLFIIGIFQQIANTFGSSKSVMRSIDFAKISSVNSEMPKYFHALLTKDRDLEELGGYKLKKFVEEDFLQWLDLLKTMPTLNLFVEMRQVTFCLALFMLMDAKATGSEALMEASLKYFRDTLNYTTSNLVLKLFGIKFLVKILDGIPNSRSIFHQIFNETGKSPKDHVIATVADLLDVFAVEKSEFAIELLMLASEVIPTPKKPAANDSSNKIAELKTRIMSTILEYLQTSDYDKKEFTRRTIQGFAYILGMYQEQCPVQEFPDDVVKLVKTYLKNAIDHESKYYVAIVKIAFQLKAIGKLSAGDITKISTKFWKVFETSTNEMGELVDFEQTYRSNNQKTPQVEAINIILENKSDNEFTSLLNEIYVAALQADTAACSQFIVKVGTLAQCTFQKQKRAIFYEFFRRILNEIVVKLAPTELLAKSNANTVLDIVVAYNSFVVNNKNISHKQIDDILSFLFLLKLSPFRTTQENRFLYITILWNTIELCISVLQNNFDHIKSRLPQFVAVIKLQLQSICWYGLENSEHYKLDALEISYLAKLAHKLEKFVFMMSKQNNHLQFHQLAPYLLVFTIQIMISKSNVTTLQPQIRTHFVNICYSLISVGGDKHRGFIMRVSSDAERRVYENLVKDYVKYRKFKGSS